jgi:hypothetical protein
VITAEIKGVSFMRTLQLNKAVSVGVDYVSVLAGYAPLDTQKLAIGNLTTKPPSAY